jgi:H3 lysine-79-specific histone-lysine N-methyltransferase
MPDSAPPPPSRVPQLSILTIGALDLHSWSLLIFFCIFDRVVFLLAILTIVMFQGGPPKRPEVRKVTVAVVRKPAEKPQPARRDSPFAAQKPLNKSLHSHPRAKSSSSNLKVPSAHRNHSSPSNLSSKPRASPSRRPPKRKAQDNLFDSSSSEDESGRGSEEPPLTAKRPKPSPALDDIAPPLVDADRETFRFDKWTTEDEKDWPIIHGAELVKRNTTKKIKYYPIFEEDGDTPTVVELKSPSNCAPERYVECSPPTTVLTIFRFSLVDPGDPSEYAPLAEISNFIKAVCETYLPESISGPLLDDGSGIVRRLTRSIKKQSKETYLAVIEEYNDAITKYLADGTIAAYVKTNVPYLDLSLVKDILDQVYSRTVSPDVKLLREYENGTDNVYGEILAPFSERIFRLAGLRKDHVFLDMGSGVGNVVLQAALATGCEAYGVEMMDNPALLAMRQQEEFEARCKRWSIVPGKVKLIHNSFLASDEIPEVMKRADVILINNQAFTPSLNDSILNLLLDAKDGCKIVSLKSFVPDGWKIRARTSQDLRNMLKVKRMRYNSDWVSWKADSGDFFIATKDSARLQRLAEM